MTTMTTARTEDSNGFVEVANNPIAKVGLFQYLGSTIEAPEPGRIYNVWRPDSALDNPETIESFRLLPWVDDHAMLGDAPGGIPAEQKGIHGVIGENVFFEYPYLKANIKVFSDELATKIEQGKIELSAGYSCKYLFTPGVTPDGRPYDAIQTNIRGNHLALVEAGRMGPDVAVLDHRMVFTVDSKEIFQMADPNDDKNKPGTGTDDGGAAGGATGGEGGDEGGGGGAMTLEEATGHLKTILPIIAQMQQLIGGAAPVAVDANATGQDGDGDDKDKGTGQDGDDDDKNKSGTGQDAAMKAMTTKTATLQAQVDYLTAIPKRNALAERIADHVGTFDHAEMTLNQVAAYGCKKMGIPTMDGAEVVAVNAYFAALERAGEQGSKTTSGTGMDAADASSQVDTYLQGN